MLFLICNRHKLMMRIAKCGVKENGKIKQKICNVIQGEVHVELNLLKKKALHPFGQWDQLSDCSHQDS